MESCDNSNVSNNNNNSHLYTDAGSCSTALDNKKVSTTTVASGSPFGFALPPELLLEILSYLKESQSALYAVSLVCRQWMLCAAPILYRHAKIGDTFRYATFILTLTRTKQTLCYGSLVHTLDLAAGSKLFGKQANMDVTNPTNNTPEYYEARDMKHGHLFVTTSSLLQVARTCKNLTCLNMSLTTLFFDSMIAETGEYVSTLQHYAVQPGLTHILIPMSTVIETLGKECTQLQEVQIQRCDWVTAQTIWLWVTHCPKLVRLDARRSNKCSVKKL
ncbi:hypothetical protein BDB00DRAFT_769364, partial [Zychaea mexicana]|uniref:uncharacterized protein n=1 Tax=Zychaea mexicana TaxID=64656 RepID=UPI0022FE4A7D